MKKTLFIFLFASSLAAQVQLGKNVQIGAGSTTSTLALQTNGTNNTSQATLNFVNPAAYNGLTFTFSNPSLGNETFTLGGTLGNAGLTNPSMTVNGTSCTLGSTCTVSGSGSSVGTAGQLQMVGSTAGSFAASALTDNGTTLTYSGTGPGCISISSSQICVTAPPYNASPDGLTTTTGTFGVGTTGSVASCATFRANQGVLITGAGAAGANYIGAVVSCTGTTLTVTPATSTSVTSVVVQHDESTAFQSAITALASTGGTIFVPDGTYLLNGPLQDTSGANAILTLPHISYGASATPALNIAFKGYTQPTTDTTHGAIITTAKTSGNVLGAFYSGSSIPNFTNVGVTLENLTFRAPTNPSVTMANLLWAVTARVYHTRFDTASDGSSPLPTTGTGSGLILPSLGNNVAVEAIDLIAAGYKNCVVAYEHTTITSLNEANCINGLVPDSGAAYAGNSIDVVHFWCQVCTNQLSAGVNKATINIEAMDIETAGSFGINDPSNLLYGKVNWNVQTAAGAVTTTNPSINGAANLKLYNLQFPAVALNSGAGGLTGAINFYNNSTTPDISFSHPTSGNLSLQGAQAAGAGLFASNLSNGTGSYSFLSSAYNNDITRQFRLLYLAPGSSFGGILTPNSGYLSTTSNTAQLIITTEATAPIVFGYNSTEKMRLQSGLCVGCTTDPGTGIVQATSLLASGTVDGTAPVTITTGTTATLGGTFKSGYTLNQEATAATAVAYTLPTAAAGLQYCVGNSWNGSAATTGVLTVNTSASGQFIIFTDGTLSATGGNVTSGGAAADFACFVGVDSTHWYFKPSSGTWTKH